MTTYTYSFGTSSISEVVRLELPEGYAPPEDLAVTYCPPGEPTQLHHFIFRGAEEFEGDDVDCDTSVEEKWTPMDGAALTRSPDTLVAIRQALAGTAFMKPIERAKFVVDALAADGFVIVPSSAYAVYAKIFSDHINHLGRVTPV